MITCPNCNHQNPDGATQCEACYTPLPSTTSCPNCGAPVQADATFCGQCGHNLMPDVGIASEEITSSSTPLVATVVSQPPSVDPSAESSPTSSPTPIPATVASEEPEETASPPPLPTVVATPPAQPATPSVQPTPNPTPPIPVQPAPNPKPPVQANAATQLQVQAASLFHVQTNTKMELPQNIDIIHIGKPNEQVPPDIDVSGFSDSGIVSRVHADIRIEGDNYFIEDVGSSNGTYINHKPLRTGDRHLLRPGDRIALGKGDKVTFIFQMS